MVILRTRKARSARRETECVGSQSEEGEIGGHLRAYVWGPLRERSAVRGSFKGLFSRLHPAPFLAESFWPFSSPDVLPFGGLSNPALNRTRARWTGSPELLLRAALRRMTRVVRGPGPTASLGSPEDPQHQRTSEAGEQDLTG